MSSIDEDQALDIIDEMADPVLYYSDEHIMTEQEKLDALDELVAYHLLRYPANGGENYLFDEWLDRELEKCPGDTRLISTLPPWMRKSLLPELHEDLLYVDIEKKNE